MLSCTLSLALAPTDCNQAPHYKFMMLKKKKKKKKKKKRQGFCDLWP
jgi:hypothetical protein